MHLRGLRLPRVRAVAAAAACALALPALGAADAGGPVIKSFAPHGAPPGGGVTISGSGFTQVSQVTIGSTPAQFQVVKKKIVATVPKFATSGPITVTTAAGTATSSSPFTVLVPVGFEGCGAQQVLAGSGIYLSQGWVLGGHSFVKQVFSNTQTTLVVNGVVIKNAGRYWDRKGEQYGNNWLVHFGYDPQITLAQPGATATVHFHVAVKGTFTDGFQWYHPGDLLWGQTCSITAVPRIVVTSVSPTSGPYRTKVTITGEHLQFVTGVHLGSWDVPFDQTPTSVTFRVPDGNDGGDLSLRESNILTLPAGRFDITPQAPLAIDSFEPQSGPPGTAVTLHGEGFLRATSVTFGGGVSTPVTQPDTDNQLTVTVPYGTRTGPITVHDATTSVGSSSQFTAIEPPGTLDTRFGPSGIKLVDIDPARVDSLAAMGMDGSGRIVAVGGSYTAPLPSDDVKVALVRMDQNGVLDPSFGGDGIAVSTFSSAPVFAPTSIAFQPDGKILVGGTGGTDDQQMVLARFLPDGTADTTFGSGGAVAIRFFSGYTWPQCGVFSPQPLVLGNGDILLAGSACGEIALARYLPDGTLDTTFAHDGQLLLALPSGEFLGFTRAALTSGGKIVFASGIVGPVPTPVQFGAVRLDPDGSLDASFGSGGEMRIPSTAQAHLGGATLDDSGNLVMVGGDGDYGFIVARVTPAGALDGSFGTAGVVRTEAPPEARAVLAEPDGDLLVAGGNGLARYSSDGTIDPSFGDHGVSYAPAGSRWVSEALGDDGSLFTAGSASADGFAFGHHPLVAFADP